jgi:hypothetical protein
LAFNITFMIVDHFMRILAEPRPNSTFRQAKCGVGWQCSCATNLWISRCMSSLSAGVAMDNTTIIAAGPGFEVLDLVSGAKSFHATPVIGWAMIKEATINADGTTVVHFVRAYPICPGYGQNELTTAGKILRAPDGTITFMDDAARFERGQEAAALQHAADTMWESCNDDE